MLLPQKAITLHGRDAAVLWGYRTAAVITSWTIRGTAQQWVLTATLRRADAFQLRQRPLSFNAPRVGGYWQWPIVALTLGESSLIATLGQPEQ